MLNIFVHKSLQLHNFSSNLERHFERQSSRTEATVQEKLEELNTVFQRIEQLESEIEGFNAIINSLRGQTTILLIEHNMNVVMALADAITVLDQGAVLATGAPDAIRADAAVQAAYLGSG